MRIQIAGDQVKTEAVSVFEIRFRAGVLLLGAAVCVIGPVPLMMESVTRIRREPYLMALTLPIFITGLILAVAFIRRAVRMIKGAI